MLCCPAVPHQKTCLQLNKIQRHPRSLKIPYLPAHKYMIPPPTRQKIRFQKRQTTKWGSIPIWQSSFFQYCDGFGLESYWPSYPWHWSKWGKSGGCSSIFRLLGISYMTFRAVEVLINLLDGTIKNLFLFQWSSSLLFSLDSKIAFVYNAF